VTGLICLAFLLGSLAQAWSNSQLIAQVQAEQVRTQQLQEYNKHLQQLADHYKDPFVIESEARQELGYVRPGEHAVVVISSNEQDKSSRSRVSHSLAAEGFWQEWWDVFFGS
jgi:cell division protein FtsB